MRTHVLWLLVAELRKLIRPLVKLSYQRSEEHTSELQSRLHLVCRLLLEKKKKRSQIRSCKVYRPTGVPNMNTEWTVLISLSSSVLIHICWLLMRCAAREHAQHIA